MKIITNDKRLSNHKRHQRLVQLIEKVESIPEDPTKKLTKLNSSISGTDLIWAQARFDQSHVQVNKFNKLKFTVFSKLSTPIKVDSLELRFNLNTLDQRIDFAVEATDQPFSLKKQSPITFERDIYVD